MVKVAADFFRFFRLSLRFEVSLKLKNRRHFEILRLVKVSCTWPFDFDSYSLAIVAINLTGLTHHLLTSGHLKSHFYNAVPGHPHIDDLHKVFGKTEPLPMC